VKIHFVSTGRTGPGLDTNPRGRLKPLRAIKQIFQIKQLAHELDLDVLHIFGFPRMARLGGLLKLIGIRTPVVVSLYGPIMDSLWKTVYRRIDHITGATEYTQKISAEHGVDVQLVRHGIVRNISNSNPKNPSTSKPRFRVLFWREASKEDGVDLCMQAFDVLASRYPEVEFNFAIRPYWDEVTGLDDLANRHANIGVYRFPYPEGISLEKLLSESLCVVLPFRRLTIHPQLAIAESLAAGVPVICSDIASTPELVFHGTNGSLVPVDNPKALESAIEKMLKNRKETLAMRNKVAGIFQEHWNWDRYASDLKDIYGRVSR